jgi:hypothetical protein
VSLTSRPPVIKLKADFKNPFGFSVSLGLVTESLCSCLLISSKLLF